jgi:hypothetical protein
MDAETLLKSDLSLEERKFREEVAGKRRELDLKEREVAVKEKELSRSQWFSPIVLGLFAAAVGLIGNIVVARVNNQNSQELERIRSQSNLVLEAIKTGDPNEACKNLIFFVGLGLLDDPNQTIRQACSSAPKGAPSLPPLSSLQGVLPLSDVPVTVRTVDANGRDVQGLGIYYVLQILEDHPESVQSFISASSPSKTTMMPGIYVFWAAKDDPKKPVTPKAIVSVFGNETNIVLRVE